MNVVEKRVAYMTTATRWAQMVRLSFQTGYQGLQREEQISAWTVNQSVPPDPWL
jgi:hypothetical protein